MKLIKFRGKRLDNGELIYGDLLHYGKYEVCIRSYSSPDKNSFSTLPVDSKSISQFVGYDADGKEVYEDDVLENDSGKEFKASLKSIITSLNNPCYCRYLENLNHRKYYRLKERGENENLS